MKPASIKTFDLLYLGSLALSVVGVIISYDALVAISEARMAAEGVEGGGAGVLLFGIVAMVLIMLALWFLVSVVRVELVKWLLALLAAYNLVTLLAASGEGPVLNLVLGWASTLMALAAVYFLFRPDAKAWFAEKRGGADPQ